MKLNKIQKYWKKHGKIQIKNLQEHKDHLENIIFLKRKIMKNQLNHIEKQ